MAPGIRSIFLKRVIALKIRHTHKRMPVQSVCIEYFQTCDLLKVLYLARLGDANATRSIFASKYLVIEAEKSG